MRAPEATSRGARFADRKTTVDCKGGVLAATLVIAPATIARIRIVGIEPAAALQVSLLAGNSLVDQDFNDYATVLGSPGGSLVRGRWSVFAHRARRHDMPHRDVALLD